MHSLHADYDRWLEELVPFNPGSDPAQGGYLHNRTGEDNADAHHKRQIMGREVVVAIPVALRWDNPNATLAGALRGCALLATKCRHFLVLRGVATS